MNEKNLSAIQTAKSLDAQTTTEQAAAVALDILKSLAPVKAERDALRAELAGRVDTREDRERLNLLTDRCIDLAYEATRVMRLHVFEGTSEYEIRDWIDDDLDALMADLADIARGDY